MLVEHWNKQVWSESARHLPRAGKSNTRDGVSSGQLMIDWDGLLGDIHPKRKSIRVAELAAVDRVSSLRE